jgi:2-dehydropantoate 2-reductase
MNIAIIGAGAIGSVVAAYLMKAGKNVILIGRDDQVKAVQKNGLHVRGVRREETIPVEIRPRLDKEYDLVIFTVKTQDLEEAVRRNGAFFKNGILLSSQNGVQADDILGKHVNRGNLYSSIVMFGATYTKPGEVVLNFEGDWIVGKPFGPKDGRLDDIKEVLSPAFSVAVSDDIIGMKWLKLFVNLNNCIPALVGRPMQEVFADMDFCRLSVLLLREGIEVVRKAGIELVSLPNFPAQRIYGLAQMPVEEAAGIINKTLTGLSKEPLYGSVLQSIMRGRASEIDFINGQVVQTARKLNLNAPLNEKAVELVHRVERGRKFFKPDEIKEFFGLAVQG